MSNLNNRFWLWGQEPGSHHTRDYRLPGVNTMDVAEGGAFLGVPNCCRVVMLDGPATSFDAEADRLRGFKQVVWSAIGAGGVGRYTDDRSDLEEVLLQAERHDNITGAVLDDFFNSIEGFENSGRLARHSLESICNMRDRLHHFPKRKLDLWMVWYSYQLDFDVSSYIDLCDVITLWTWKGSDLWKLDENIEKFAQRTEGKRRLVGCYMWNYGERCPLTPNEVTHQLERYEYWMSTGVIEGVIFCSNAIADLGLEAVEYTRAWIAKLSA